MTETDILLFQFYSASPLSYPQACQLEYYEDETVTQKISNKQKKKAFKMQQKKMSMTIYFTCTNNAGIWEEK